MLNVIQTRVAGFEKESLPFKTFISGTNIKSLIETTDIFLDGLRSLGVGELYARQQERESQLNSLSDRSAYSKSMFTKYNDLGIRRITDAQLKLKGLAKELSVLIKPEEVKKLESKLKVQIEEFKLQCVDLEIKGRDVEKLFTSVDQLFQGFQKKGADGVIEIMDKKMTELIATRKSPDRGAIDNFPVWKVIAIVIALGAWIIGAIHCGFFSCSLSAGLAYYIVFQIAVIVAFFC